MKKSNNTSKDTKYFLLSSQVYRYLSEKGFSHLFNWNDYHLFKNRVQKSFNKAFDIAMLIIEDNTNNKSDYADYEF